MRILYISHYYLPLVGGLMKHTQVFARELSRRHEVHVAATMFREPLFCKPFVLHDSLLIAPFSSYLDDEVEVHSLTPATIDRFRMLPLVLRAAPFFRHTHYRKLRRFGYRFYRDVYVPKLRQIIRGMDIVHSVAADYLGWAAEEAARAEGVPFIVSTAVHPGLYGDDQENVDYYNRADAVLALLDSGRTKLIEIGVQPDLIRVIGVPPVLPEDADPGNFRTRHHLHEVPIVLYVGRVEEYKGALALLESAPAVWHEIPNVHFLFAGPANERALSWFEKHRDERIRYLGTVSEQEKASAFAACDVFCMPSIGEALGGAYLEAWSYSKPVIGGTAYGIPELIEEHEAGLSTDQNPLNIARNIVRLLDDEHLRQSMGERGNRMVAERFSKETLVGALEETYAEVTRASTTGADLIALL